ncbi:MAG TPA: aminoacyl--tRNA ligase-related protein [Candidatus Paceibacterota bacterium]
MRQSQLFTKTQKTSPKDEESKNAQLLIRAGFIHKEMAGVYTYLPLGLRVFNKIARIIREEMNAIGGQELLMTTLQNPEIWKKSGRWSEDPANAQSGLPWFKTKLASGAELGIANTHEEALTNILRQYISSYKDLPVYAYQFQNKFRNELRAKSGIMRTREFVMKDLYSFNKTEEEFRMFYEECAKAYLRIFSRLGIGDKTFRTFASGGAFSKFSDEFQTLCEAGEDTIYLDREKKFAVNDEVYTDEVLADIGLTKDKLEKIKAIEVGNIFPLGTKYSDALGLKYRDEHGEEKPVFMGCYGIGLGRVMGTVVEVLSDEKGIVWPISIAPFHVHLIGLPGVEAEAEKLYKELSRYVEVLYDDRADVRAGEKFADADLIGIPHRVIVSKKTLEQKSVEVKERKSGHIECIPIEELQNFLARPL